MSIALQITLVVVLVALTAGFVSMSFQVGRAARSLDAFLQAAQKDLSRMTEDAHAATDLKCGVKEAASDLRG